MVVALSSFALWKISLALQTLENNWHSASLWPAEIVSLNFVWLYRAVTLECPVSLQSEGRKGNNHCWQLSFWNGCPTFDAVVHRIERILTWILQLVFTSKFTELIRIVLFIEGSLYRNASDDIPWLTIGLPYSGMHPCLQMPTSTFERYSIA